MNKKLNFFSVIRFLSKYIFKYKRHFIMFYCGWLFDTVLSIVIPILFGIMINEMVYYQNISTFVRLSILFVVLSAFSCLLYFFIYAQHHYLMSMYTIDIKKDIFNHILKCDAQYMADASTGDIIATIQNYSTECMNLIIRNISHLINIVLSIIAVSIYLMLINWKIGILALIISPVSVYVNGRFGKKIRAYGDQQRQYYSGYISWVYEVLSSIRDLRLLGAKKKADDTFADNHKKIFRINIKTSISSITAEKIISFFNLCVQLAIFTLAGYAAVSGDITVGALTIIVTFYTYLSGQISYVSNSYLDAQNRVSFIQHIFDLMQSPTEDEGKDKQSLNITKGCIHFNRINFSYNNSNPIICDFNLDIGSGERFALVGKSGCGKTTIAYMLIGFYRPQSGYIEIDGQKLSDCNLRSIRQSVGIIQQDVLIFDGTIRENILLGNPNASEDEIILTCKQAGIWDFVNELPDGLDTHIGVNGINLSGGQKQRISIARIYLRNPRLIIFDEATSSLDAETEASIHEEWKKVLIGRTAIVIAHRQNSVMLCEKAAIMENGSIVEVGIPSDMAVNSERFKSLFALQEDKDAK